MTSEQIAFNILQKHPDCIRDDVSLNDLMADIADAIDRAKAQPAPQRLMENEP